jgi:hypothetical protein
MHYFISPDGTQVLSFPKEKNARAKVKEVEGSFYASDAPSTLADLPLTLLVTLHNIIRPEKPVRKFADRDTATKRMAGVLEALATPGTVSEASPVAGAIGDAGAPATNGAEPKQPKTPSERAGKLKGMTILRLTRANPRKAGTSGGRSWDLITKGMTVEEFLAAGGIRRDLEWDIDHKWTTVIPTAEYSNTVEEDRRIEYEAALPKPDAAKESEPAAAAS